MHAQYQKNRRQRIQVKSLILVAGLFSSTILSASVVSKADCKFKGKALYGKVQIVDSFPDFTVKKVESFPDLNVQEVQSFPDSCGKWQFVTSFPDFKIKYVESFPDFQIKVITSFPGVP